MNITERELTETLVEGLTADRRVLLAACRDAADAMLGLVMHPGVGAECNAIRAALLRAIGAASWRTHAGVPSVAAGELAGEEAR